MLNQGRGSENGVDGAEVWSDTAEKQQKYNKTNYKDKTSQTAESRAWLGKWSGRELRFEFEHGRRTMKYVGSCYLLPC